MTAIAISSRAWAASLSKQQLLVLDVHTCTSAPGIGHRKFPAINQRQITEHATAVNYYFLCSGFFIICL